MRILNIKILTLMIILSLACNNNNQQNLKRNWYGVFNLNKKCDADIKKDSAAYGLKNLFRNFYVKKSSNSFDEIFEEDNSNKPLIQKESKFAFAFAKFRNFFRSTNFRFNSKIKESLTKAQKFKTTIKELEREYNNISNLNDLERYKSKFYIYIQKFNKALSDYKEIGIDNIKNTELKQGILSLFKNKKNEFSNKKIVFKATNEALKYIRRIENLTSFTKFCSGDFKRHFETFKRYFEYLNKIGNTQKIENENLKNKIADYKKDYLNKEKIYSAYLKFETLQNEIKKSDACYEKLMNESTEFENIQKFHVSYESKINKYLITLDEAYQTFNVNNDTINNAKEEILELYRNKTNDLKIKKYIFDITKTAKNLDIEYNKLKEGQKLINFKEFNDYFKYDNLIDRYTKEITNNYLNIDEYQSLKSIIEKKIIKIKRLNIGRKSMYAKQKIDSIEQKRKHLRQVIKSFWQHC
ncbi:MAG: hypothetical protein GY830_00225 [Bacteroidetes bacterium]|nr:hypothetical protein [Bacteroidota bacterium]